MATWTNEVVMEFVELYGSEPILWDPKHPSHKDRHDNNDAWLRIQSKLSCRYSIEDLKRKKDYLMKAFRLNVRIKKKRPRSKIKWFPFNAMHSFLGGKYECDSTVGVLENDYLTSSASPTIPASDSRKRNAAERSSATNIQLKYHSNESDYSYVRKQHVDADPHFNVNDSLLRDECELYGILLAKKLRKLNEHQRDIAMHEIDNILFRVKMQTSAQGENLSSSPTHTSHIAVPKTESPVFIVTEQEYEDEDYLEQEHDELQETHTSHIAVPKTESPVFIVSEQEYEDEHYLEQEHDELQDTM